MAEDAMVDSITVMDMRVSNLWERLEDQESGCTAVHGVTESDTAKRLNTCRLIPGQALF